MAPSACQTHRIIIAMRGLLFACALAGASISYSQIAPQYRAHLIPAQISGQNVQVYSMNSSGQVAMSVGFQHGIYTAQEGFKPFQLEKASFGGGHCVADSGYIAAQVRHPNQSGYSGAVARPGRLLEPLSIFPKPSVRPLVISEDGTVFGPLYGGGNFLYSQKLGQEPQQLVAAELGGMPFITSINRHGQFVVEIKSGRYLYSRGNGLIAKPFGLESAYSINDQGWMTGSIYNPTIQESEGYLYVPGSGLRRFDRFSGTFAVPMDVNNQGIVMGEYGGINHKTFLWSRDTGFVDLRSRTIGIPESATIMSPRRLTATGSVLVSTDKGNIIITPVPDLSALATLAIGIASMLRHQYIRRSSLIATSD